MAIMVLVTIPQNKAASLAKIILAKRVCACVNIVKGIESFFWWQGKIDSAKETLLIIKTKNSLFTKLKKIIKTVHPYEVPEIIAFKIDKINKDYLKWLDKEAYA
jgi:periplasmic divalent cation tolerance protein